MKYFRMKKNILNQQVKKYLKIIKKDETIEEKNIILGIYQQSLTKKGEYQALMGMEFI